MGEDLTGGMMETTERITPERVAAAYAKIGMKPMNCGSYDCGEHCCGLTAVAFAEKVASKANFAAATEEQFMKSVSGLGLSQIYLSGFVSGFDEPESDSRPFDPAEYQYGFEDGRAAAIRMGLYAPEEEEGS